MSNVTKLFETESSIHPVIFQGGWSEATATEWKPAKAQAMPHPRNVASPDGTDPHSSREEALDLLDNIPVSGMDTNTTMENESHGHSPEPTQDELLEAMRQEAYALGRQEALGEIEATEQNRALALAQNIQKLMTAAEQLDQTYRWEAVNLGCHIAKSVLGSELAVGAPLIERSVEHVLTAIPRCQELTIRCHPSDRKEMEQHLPSLQRKNGQLVAVNLSEDPSIELGGLVVDFGAGSLDTQPSIAVDVLREAIEREIQNGNMSGSPESNTMPSEEIVPQDRTLEEPEASADTAEPATIEEPTVLPEETQVSAEDEIIEPSDPVEKTAESLDSTSNKISETEDE